MKNLLYLPIFCLFFTPIFSQTPVLVTDFNPGSDDSFDQWNYVGASIGDYLILPVSSNEVGLEPGVYSNGTLSILKDINEGSAPSNPSQFTEYNGKIYFSATNANGGALYVSDGTPEGTEMLFQLTSGAPMGLIVANPNHLYFSSGSTLYRTDGIELETIFSGIRLRKHQWWDQNANHNLYRGNLAFARADNWEIEVFVVEGDEVVKLVTGEELSARGDILGFAEVEEGIIFNHEGFPSSSDAFGTYIYSASDSSVTKMEINDNPFSRTIPFNQNVSLGWVVGSGYYITNGTEEGTIRIINSSLFIWLQNNTFENAVQGNQLAFVGSFGTFGPNYLYLTDGTIDGTIQLNEIRDHRSIMISKGNYAFIAAGTSNGLRPDIFMIDFENQSSSILHSFSMPSNQSNSIQLVAVHNDKLFFTSNLDPSVGRELYYLELGFSVNTDDISTPEPLDILITNSTYTLRSDNYSDYKLEIYSLDGRLIESGVRQTNSTYDYSHLQGMYLLRFIKENQSQSVKIFSGE